MIHSLPENKKEDPRWPLKRGQDHWKFLKYWLHYEGNIPKHCFEKFFGKIGSIEQTPVYRLGFNKTTLLHISAGADLFRVLTKGSEIYNSYYFLSWTIATPAVSVSS